MRILIIIILFPGMLNLKVASVFVDLKWKDLELKVRAYIIPWDV